MFTTFLVQCPIFQGTFLNVLHWKTKGCLTPTITEGLIQLSTVCRLSQARDRML